MFGGHKKCNEEIARLKGELHEKLAAKNTEIEKANNELAEAKRRVAATSGELITSRAHEQELATNNAALQAELDTTKKISAEVDAALKEYFSQDRKAAATEAANIKTLLTDAVAKAVADASGKFDPAEIKKYVAEAVKANFGECNAYVDRIAESLGTSVKSALGDALAARIAYETELTMLKTALSEKVEQVKKYEADILEYSQKLRTLTVMQASAQTAAAVAEENRTRMEGIERVLGAIITTLERYKTGKEVTNMANELESLRADYRRLSLEAESYRSTIEALRQQMDDSKAAPAEPSDKKKGKRAQTDEAEILEYVHKFCEKGFTKAPEMIYSLYKAYGARDVAGNLRELFAEHKNIQDSYHALMKLASGK